jgi:DNA-binding NarL/FixJ family response regulator
VFLAQQTDPDVVGEAFNVGASGFIVKMDAGSDLLAGIDAVLRGERFVSASLRRNGFSRKNRGA